MRLVRRIVPNSPDSWALSPFHRTAVRYETRVTPLPDEDIASRCHYELTTPTSARKVMAVWVIFDRGRDVHDLYRNEAVLAFARRFRIALLLHGHCPGKTVEDHNDMNMDPSKGLGRALFAALDQFAINSGHRELASIRLIFLGFSGAGPLSARFVASYPNRVLAAVLSSTGHYEPLGLDTVELNNKSLRVPELMIAGSADTVSGTTRPYRYFENIEIAVRRGPLSFKTDLRTVVQLMQRISLPMAGSSFEAQTTTRGHCSSGN